MRVELNDVEKKILEELRRNSKQTYKELSRKLGLAIGTIHNKIKKLERKGVILNYTVNIDYSKAGYDLTGIIMIKVEGPFIIEVEKKLAEFEEIMSVYDITGEFDIAVIAKFKDREHLNRVIKKILSMPHIERTNTSIVLSIVKENFI
ncbi:MAG: Lrp/AsnC family transcriptional regulator [archaeon GB-1867-097]|nr:Lrp/AsnC family transcriptional regulator [Candidatus Verstraetearchaeota archaeon]MCS7373799.1 Lrp/AsnC family transcriptional regulator [Candidatus Culexmicrobium thermophilum]MCS7384907.1 Lrp/AsnC family transcriptional regulator [Candidatus Culexmicrobium thermophilum]RLE57502.1 MAG: AsnC family transcriptional regulator [Candidatus Verstraetearchaeota archaeon]